MEIIQYKKCNEKQMIQLLKKHGEEWSCYWHDSVVEKYKKALETSITFLAYEHKELVGFIRCLDDCGFYIYICDLLVDQDYRGKSIGKKLMDFVVENYSTHVVYVMSDVDEYYKKLNYRKEGSVFEVVK